VPFTSADLPGIRLGQHELIQPPRAPGAEDVRAGHLDAELGQHAVDLVLAAGAQLHRLAAVPRDLSQLADLRRGDPRLGQPTHPQQVGQVAGVELVVLDPAVAEGLDTERAGTLGTATGSEEAPLLHMRSPELAGGGKESLM
jgi:hypothetical protein